MSKVLEYYRNYHKSGHYTLEQFKGSSRHLMIQGWLKSNLKPGAKVLDVGCGDGSYSLWMPEFHWTGIDIYEDKSKYNGVRLVHDLEQVPYDLEAGAFDAVVCSEVLEHLLNPEHVNKEIYRLLKSRGIYVLSTPNFDWVEHALKTYAQVLYAPKFASHTKEHIRFYNLETHASMLKDEGFSLVDVCGADIQFGGYFQRGRSVLKETLLNKADGEIDLIIGRMFPTSCHTIGILAVKP